MEILRTPDERFAGLAGFPWTPRWTEVDGLRMAHVEDGPAGADPVLLLHGEPTWSYLYRKMIPVLAEAGLRAVAPDLVGFGRSDKPARREDHTYARQVAWTGAWIEAVDLRRITLVCQDWGSLIGLRLVAERPERFARVVVANGWLPEGRGRLPAVFRLWRAFARWSPWFPCGWIVRAGCARGLSAEARRAYEAPFPDARHRAGPRALPLLVPVDGDDPAAADNRRAWEALERWDRPLLTLFGDLDPVFRGADRGLQRRVPGAAGQPHRTLRRAGHFVQEDAGPELARMIVEWMG